MFSLKQKIAPFQNKLDIHVYALKCPKDSTLNLDLSKLHSDIEKNTLHIQMCINKHTKYQ